MNAEKARIQVERLMYLARGTLLQSRLWTLHEICDGDYAFLEAAKLSPKLLRMSLKITMKNGRKRITESDIKAAKNEIDDKHAKSCFQTTLFEMAEVIVSTVKILVNAGSIVKKAIIKKLQPLRKGQQTICFSKWYQYALF